MVIQNSIPTVADLTRERAQQALSTSHIHALRKLRVDGSGDSLQIHGRVSSFYHKQLAQEVVLAVSAGLSVVNVVSVL